MTAKRESGLRARIATALRARGWLVLVQHGSAYTAAGVSDLLVNASGRFCAIEVKTDTGTPSPSQILFLKQVRRAGGVSFIARSARAAVRGVEYFREKPMPEQLELNLDDLLASLDYDHDTATTPPNDTPSEAYEALSFDEPAVPTKGPPDLDIAGFPMNNTGSNIGPAATVNVSPGQLDEQHALLWSGIETLNTRISRLSDLVQDLAQATRALADGKAIRDNAQDGPKTRKPRAAKATEE